MKSIFVSLSIILGISVTAFGQTAKHTENSPDQALRGSGRVNGTTLGMEISIPLGNYPGRGINVPISLSYSSKVWRMNYEGDTPGSVATDKCRTLNVPKYAEETASGWTTSLQVPYIEYVGKDNYFTERGFPFASDQVGCVGQAPPQTDNAFVKRLVIHLPGGETHEMRASDTPILFGGSPTAHLQQSQWNTTFYAVDGSNLIYIENSVTGTFKLRTPDGSYYDFATTAGDVRRRYATKFTDRNGNYTTYNANGTLTDTLGRTLSPPIPAGAPSTATSAGNPQSYSMPGMSGSYKFHWKNLKGTSPSESGLTNFYQDLKYKGQHISMISNGNWNTHPAGTFLFGSLDFAFAFNAGEPLFNPVVMTEIELPTGQKYKFSYDLYGRIEKIVYPTGGEEIFTYTQVAPLTPAVPDSISDNANFGVSNRKVYETPSGSFYEWTYAANHVTGGYKVTTTAPDNTLTERVTHRANDYCPTCDTGTFGFDNGLSGLPYEESAYDGGSPRKLVSQKLTTWAKKSFTAGGLGVADWHPRVTQEESRVYDSTGNGVSATTKYEYEGDLNYRETPLLEKKTSQYAFVTVGSAVPANPLRSTENTFLINDSAYSGVETLYTDQNMIGLVTASVVKDAAGTIVSRGETVYDESGYSPNVGRGNPTTAKAWDSTKGVYTNPSAYLVTRAKFNSYGKQYEATDAKGLSTTTTFDGTYQAFPTQVTSPVPSDGTYGSNSSFVTYSTFDFTTGLPLDSTDINGLKTVVTYDSVTLRPMNTKTYNQGNQVGSTTETVYNDVSGSQWVKNRTQIDANKWAESITYFDGLGRAWKTEEVDSNGNIIVEKEFDADGRVSRVTNPFRVGEAKLWTTNIYDEASRIKEVMLPDTAKVKTDYGVSTTAPIGVTKQITDQAGKKRKGFSDSLGRMVRVIEDPTGQNLNTDYVFDVLGNLRKTTQGEQNRYFMHDSLGRLLYAKQPEQTTNGSFVATDPITGNTGWSAKYEYDDNSNITKTTDARNVYVTATYDNLNRIKVRDYSDVTPDVSFYHDGRGLGAIPAHSNGKTARIASSVSETRNTSFDNLGRLLAQQQITDGQTYSTAYAYNLSGALIEQTYPSGRVVKNTLDGDGDLEQVQSKKGLNGFFTYADAISYNSAGSITKLQLGNGKWETFKYNDRQQITQIGLGTTDANTNPNLLKLEFGYGTSTQNNGSMLEQKITVPTVGSNPSFTATQTYAYDSLNRIQSASENISYQTWKQTYTYDRYGNRRFDAANTTTIGSCPAAVCNPNINTSDNRFSGGQGYSYDANGNVMQDATGQRFKFDAGNHQKEFFNSSNPGSTPDWTYWYDGDGRRVKKESASEVTVFVYDAAGKLVAEYASALSQTQEVSYLTADHLGSPRITTNENGFVTNRKDFMAYGDEAISAQRVSGTNGNAYTASDVRKDYTGYEKDTESGLQFAQARYYSPTQGRFASVDPLMASASIRNPQTLNRYSYVLNSPYKFVDPLGLVSENTIACGNRCSNSLQNSGGGAFDSAMNGGFVRENESITVNLNIVFDSSQFNQQTAIAAMQDSVKDLQSTFSAINVTFNVTYTAGSADVVSRGHSECSGCAYNITRGAVDGAVNVFLHQNSLLRSVSMFRPENAQIFIEKSGPLPKDKLAHEVGHLFRFFVNGDPRTGIPLPTHTGGGWTTARSGVHSEDSIIDGANARMRLGPMAYGSEYVDNYRTVSSSQITPGRTANILGDMSPRRNVPRSPSPYDVYRLGARVVAGQGR